MHSDIYLPARPPCPRPSGVSHHVNATLASFYAAVAHPHSALFTLPEILSTSVHTRSCFASEDSPSLTPSTRHPRTRSGCFIQRGPVQNGRAPNHATARVTVEPPGFIASGFDGDCEILLPTSVKTAQAVARATLVTSDEWARTRLEAEILGCGECRVWGSGG